jgi:hypothetical protein
VTAKAVAHDLKDMLRECKREGLMGCCSRSEGGLLPRYRSLPAVLRQQGLEDEAHLLQVLFICLLEEFKELLVLMGEELLCLPISPTGSLTSTIYTRTTNNTRGNGTLACEQLNPTGTPGGSPRRSLRAPLLMALGGAGASAAIARRH